MDAYLLVKFVHVFLVVITGGASAASGIWLELPGRSAAEEAYVLRSVRFVQLAVVIPGLTLVPIVGAALVVRGHWPLSTAWLLGGVAAWVVLMAGLAGDAFLMRHQSRVLAASGLGSPAYRRIAMAGRVLGGVLGLLFMAILYLMVVKPG